MKKLLLILLFPLLLQAQVIVTEDFETTGVPDATYWGASGDSVNWDYSILPLLGLESLRINKTGSYAQFHTSGWDAISEVYIFGIWRTTGIETGGSKDFIRIMLGGTTSAQVYQGGSKLVGYHGATYAMSATIKANTKYYIWIHFVQGTGSDGVLQVWLSETGIKPGSPTINISNGTSTTLFNNFRYYGYATTIPVYLDHFIASTADIGDFCSTALDTAKLYMPGNGATGQLLKTKLQWTNVTDVDSYYVQISKNSGFTSNIETAWVDTNYYNTGSLANNTKYYWKVSAINVCDTSVSDTRYFTTASLPTSAAGSRKTGFGGWGGFSNWLSSVGTASSTTQTLTDTSIIFALTGASASTGTVENYTVGGNLLPETKYLRLTNTGTQTVSNIRWTVNNQYDYFNFNRLGQQLKSKYGINLATATHQDSIDWFADLYYDSWNNFYVYGVGPPMYVATVGNYNNTLRSGLQSQCGPITTAKTLFARAVGYHVVGVSHSFGATGHIQGGVYFGASDSLYTFENLYYQGLQYQISGDKSSLATIHQQVHSDTSGYAGLTRAAYGDYGKLNDNPAYNSKGPGLITGVGSILPSVSYDTLNLPNPNTSGITLRPNEEIYLDWQNSSPTGLTNTTTYGDYYADIVGENTKYIYRTIYTYPVDTSHCDSLSNINFGSGINTMGLTSDGTGSFVVNEYKAFTVVDGYVDIKYKIATTSDSINLFLREHNPGNYNIHYNDQKIILPHHSGSDTTISVHLDSLRTYPLGQSQGTNVYHIRYELKGTAANIGIESITQRTFTLFNPLVFSHLEKGANTINWYYDAGTTKNLTAEFGYVPQSATIDPDSVFVYLSQDTATANGMTAIDVRIIIRDVNGLTIGGQGVTLTSNRSDDEIRELRLHKVNYQGASNRFVFDSMNHPNTSVQCSKEYTNTDANGYKWYSRGTVHYTLKSWTGGTSTYTLKTDAGATLKTFTVTWLPTPNITEQFFELAGTPPGWYMTAPVNFNYADSVIYGDSSLYIGNTGMARYVFSPAVDSIWVAWIARFDTTFSPANNRVLFDLTYNSTIHSQLYIGISKKLLPYNTSASFGSYGSEVLSQDNKYYFWAHYVKSDRFEVYVSTSPVIPASPDVSILSGIGSQQVNRVHFDARVSEIDPVIIDNVKISTQKIYWNMDK